MVLPTVACRKVPTELRQLKTIYIKTAHFYVSVFLVQGPSHEMDMAKSALIKMVYYMNCMYQRIYISE